MQRINEDIKTAKFQNIYLLYGNEDYLRKQYRKRLSEALNNSGDAMNCHYFEGKDISPEKLIDLAETVPFFADRRVLIIENSGFFKGSREELSEYLKNPSPTSYFIFSETEVDKRSKMYKTVKDAGYAGEFKTQDENTLKRWILGILKRENKQISERTLQLFLEKTGTDMENIQKELEKVICYTLDKDTVLPEDIEAVCSVQISNRIFDMISAVAEKRQREALGLYYDLLALKEPPMRILFLIARQFNMLLQTKELKKKGYDNKTIGEKTGLVPFIAGKYAAQASRFSAEILRQAMEDCIETDESVKTGKISDNIGVEMLIIKYSTK